MGFETDVRPAHPDRSGDHWATWSWQCPPYGTRFGQAVEVRRAGDLLGVMLRRRDGARSQRDRERPIQRIERTFDA